MSKALQDIRSLAIAHSFFEPVNLKTAVMKLGFIQADPIRSPARAQDLILRHRVKGYKAGDLERHFASLDIEEDSLYAYGFVDRRIWELLHPRESVRLTKLETRVLDAVLQSGPTHPAKLQESLGRKRVINDWGGYSQATTRALEHLHYRGLLRIARRERGIRVYEAAIPCRNLPQDERLNKLVLSMTNILAPVPIQTLHSNVARFRYLGNPRAAVRQLILDGVLETRSVHGLEYVWPTAVKNRNRRDPVVRFLAPFDPLVWDRRRFEHLWGWAYRFEAYTPPSKRVRGYYALPMLWGDDVIGWTNACVRDGKLSFDIGFVRKPYRDKAFRSALDEECLRFKAFLGVEEWTTEPPA